MIISVSRIICLIKVFQTTVFVCPAIFCRSRKKQILALSIIITLYNLKSMSQQMVKPMDGETSDNVVT